MATTLVEDPTGVNDLSPRYEIGGLYEYVHATYGHAYYKYYQFLDAVTYGAGDVLEHASANGTGVSQDRASGASSGRVPAGVALGVMTQNYFGFAQVSGRGTVILRTDGAVAAADYIVSHTADDEADTMLDGEEEQVFAMSGTTDGADNLIAGVWHFKSLL